MSFILPTIGDFKTQFFRDFPYGGTNGDFSTVQDQDVANAFNSTNVNFNPELFADQSSFTLGYLLLSAHYMVMNLRASSQGILGKYSWLQNNKSVGNVSEGLQIPDRIMANPEYAMLCQTNYGAQFLFLVLPQLTGQMFISMGVTNP